MLNPIASLLLTTAILSPVTLPLNQADTLISQRMSCETAIFNMESQIKNGRTIPLAFNFRQLSSDWQKGAPPQRIYELLVIMGEVSNLQPVDAVMNSTQMLTNLATQVINSCPNIGAVTYSKKHTGDSRTFGLLTNGVRQFDCAAPLDRNNPRRIIPWGQQFCDQ